MGLQKGQKNIAIEELEKIWNTVDVVAISITINAVAILKQRQKKILRKAVNRFL